MKLIKKVFMVISIIILPFTMLNAIEPKNVVTNNKTVHKVHDGDSIKVYVNNNLIMLRLAGIEAPETSDSSKLRKVSKRCKVSELTILELGDEAREYLLTKIKPNDHITYEHYGYGYFGRPIIWITGVNGVKYNPSIDLVAKGYVQVRRSGLIFKSDKKKLYELEKEARSSNLGIWQYIPKPCL